MVSSSWAILFGGEAAVDISDGIYFADMMCVFLMFCVALVTGNTSVHLLSQNVSLGEKVYF